MATADACAAFITTGVLPDAVRTEIAQFDWEAFEVAGGERLARVLTGVREAQRAMLLLMTERRHPLVGVEELTRAMWALIAADSGVPLEALMAQLLQDVVTESEAQMARIAAVGDVSRAIVTAIEHQDDTRDTKVRDWMTAIEAVIDG
jgi:hypothetical protein